jgi:hypothetical protein
MESHYSVLHHCQNHWKADLLATITYSSWYHYYTSKMNKEQLTIPKKQAAKRSKTVVNDIDIAHAPEPEVEGLLGTPTPENLVKDLDNAPSGPSPQVKQGMQQTGNKNGTKPRARRVVQKDPL